MKLEIKDLHVSVSGKEILNGISLEVNSGEKHVIMGPNGSGKSTLAKAIMGHPKFTVTSGEMLVDGKSINGLATDKRARLGLFLQFQDPVEIDGVGFISFLRAAKESVDGKAVGMKDFMKDMRGNISSLKLGDEFIGRSLNQGFSGGEKKKAEVLQMAMLKPGIAILDEPDSGLDIDAIKVVAENINKIADSTKPGLLIITHHTRILGYMKPDFVHVMVDGRIVANGGSELSDRLEKEGYNSYISKDSETSR